VDPSNQKQNDPGNGVPRHADGPTSANGQPGNDDRWLRSVVENSSETVTIVDPDGTLRYANPAWERVLGYHPDEAVGTMNMLDHVHPEDLTHVLEETEKALAEGGITTNKAEYRFRHKDGSWRWMESVGTYLLDDPEVGGVVVTSRDVTQRKEAEEAKGRLARRNQLILDSAGEGICGLDREGRTTFVNRMAASLTGYEPEELIGRFQHDLVHHSCPDGTPYPREECPIYATLADAEVRQVDDEVFWRKGGTSFPVEYTSTPILEDGEVAGAVVTFTDVTEPKEARVALKESEERYRIQSRELSLLHHVCSALAQELDLPTVFYKVVETIAETYGYTQVSAYLLEGEDLLLQHQVGYEQVIERIPLTEGVSGRTVRSGHPVLVEDVSTDPDFLGAVEGVTSEICVPLLDEDGAVGFLNVESKGGVKLTLDDLRLMVALSEHVSVAISRAKLHTRVRNSEEHFRALTQNSSDIVTLLRAVGTIRYQSPAIERILGYRPEETIGDNAFDYVHPDDRERVEMAFAEGLIDPRRRPSAEYRFRHKDGSWVWLESVGTNLLDDPGVGEYVVNSRDVTGRKEAEEALKVAEERYRTLIEQIPAVTYIDPADDPETSLYTSPQIERMLGYTSEEWQTNKLWPKRLHPHDRERILAADERFESGDGSFSEEYRLLAKDGSVVWVHEEAVLVRGEGGEPLYWQGVIFDTTKRKEAEERLREAEDRYRMLVEQVPAVIYVQQATASGSVTYVSPQMKDLLAYEPEECISDPEHWVRIIHPEDRERVLAVNRRVSETGEPFSMEYRQISKGGRVVWVRDEATLVVDGQGNASYWLGVQTDVTERKALEDRLRRQAFHDALTDLPNRYLFVDRLGHALDRTGRRRGRRVAVLFMDLDDFKIVNDSLGHEMGDGLLVAVSERLKGCLRPEDTLARFGGDEFVVLLEDVDGPDEPVRVAQRITHELRGSFVLDGRELYARTSIGIAMGEVRTKDPDDLLRDADTAMYRAKDEGSSYAVFDPAMYDRALDRLEAESDLRHAVEREEFVVHYQPIVSLQSDEVSAVEALVRWDHPERGFLESSEFVPMAENSGLVVPMGDQVLRESCFRAKEWQKEHPRVPPLMMSVNLSAKQLSCPDLAETVERILGETGLEGSQLTLDVTETVYVRALETNTVTLHRLRSMGVRIFIDDFGTGYSSLSYLKRLPAEAIKIDKSFVKGLREDVEDTAIVRMIIELAHTLRMKVIAEGVETEEQAELLREMGCDMAQGHYFSKPLPAEAASEFLADSPS
jgi:diguanylate cyclase (GGDEF)-like protein/PAS domain S-box-containing protein